MEYPGQTIYTPYDEDPGAPYLPHWRHLIARVWLDNENLRLNSVKLFEDDYLQQYYEVMKIYNMSSDKRVKLSDSQRGYLYALSRLEERGIESERMRIEAMLLTNVSYDVISKDLDPDRLDPEYVRAFERIGFNIRNEAGITTQSCYLKTRFSIPVGASLTTAVPLSVRWRFVASTLGYTGLMHEWEWRNGCHGELKSPEYLARERYLQVATMIYGRILAGGPENLDILGYLGHTVDRERVNNEKVVSHGQADKSGAILMQIVHTSGPKMLSAALSTDEELEQKKALKTHIQAKAAIAATKIQDKGRAVGNEIVNDELIKKISNPEK